MKINKCSLLVLILLMLFSGCVVNKPDSLGISYPDYNERSKITDAHYKKKLSATGITVVIGSGIAGAAVGYNMNLINYQNGEVTQPVKPVNALIGGVIGYSVSSLVNLMIGQNKKVDLDAPEKWIKKINKDYAFVPETRQGNNFILINKATEPKYIVKNIEDAKQFKATFPNSNYQDDIMKNGIENCRRDELISLINLFPNSKYVYNAKEKYILLSNTYEDLKKGLSYYPEVKIEVENKFVGLVKNISNATDFNSRYPNSKYKKNIVINAFDKEGQSKSDILILQKNYSNDFILTKSDLNVNNVNDRIKKNYLAALFNISTFDNQFDVLDFYLKYKYIDYYGRSNEILENVWNVNYNKFDNGNFLIGQIYALVNDYPDLNIKEYEIDNFIETKLRNEISKVKQNNLNVIDNQSANWEQWKEYKVFDAPFVQQTGKIQYFCYGSIKNDSKFDLPVKLEMSLPLQKKTTSKLWILSNETVQELGTGTIDFYIPLVKSGQEFPFAALFDFGEGTTAQGVKFLFVRAYEEIERGNASMVIKYGNRNIPESTYRKQKEWLDFATKGFSTMTVTDYWGMLTGSAEYNKQDYLDSYKKFKNDLKEAMVDAARNSSGSVGSSDCDIELKSKGTVNTGGQDRPYYVATISSGRKSIEVGYYYHSGSTWKGSAGYYEYHLIEYENYLGKTDTDVRQYMIKEYCERFK